MWKLDNNNSSHWCAAIHKQICIYKTYLDDNTLCCAITQLLNIKGQRHREHLLTISLPPTNITMGKVSLLCIFTENTEWKHVSHKLFFYIVGVDNALTNICRSYSTRTEISRVGTMSAWATVLTSTPTSTAATLSGWRVAASWCMRDPTTWATSTSSAGGSTLTTSAWLESTTASAPAAWFPW